MAVKSIRTLVVATILSLVQARDCITCPATFSTGPNYAPGPYETYSGNYGFVSYIGKTLAGCFYYDTKTNFEIECYYDVLSGAYAGEITQICPSTAAVGKDLQPTTRPPFSFGRHTTISPFIVCNDLPVSNDGITVCRNTIDTLDNVCRGLSAASLFSGACIFIPGQQNLAQRNLLSAGEALTRKVFNLENAEDPSQALQQAAFINFFGSVQATLSAAGVSPYDDASRAVRDIYFAFSNADSRICGVAESEPFIVGQAEQCGILANSYRRSCSTVYPGEFRSPFGARSDIMSPGLEKRSDNACTDFLSALSPFLPDCAAVLALGNGQDCSALSSNVQTPGDIAAAQASCQRSNQAVRALQEVCAIVSAVRSIEGQCTATNTTPPPATSKRAIRRDKEKKRIDAQYWNPDARHWRDNKEEQ